jgi:hypothetical protein
MWRACEGPGDSGVYGARTVSCSTPGIRVVENRDLFCSIDCGRPRRTTGSTASASSRVLKATAAVISPAARSTWAAPAAPFSASLSGSANRKKKFALSAMRSRRPR